MESVNLRTYKKASSTQSIPVKGVIKLPCRNHWTGFSTVSGQRQQISNNQKMANNPVILASKYISEHAYRTDGNVHFHDVWLRSFALWKAERSVGI